MSGKHAGPGPAFGGPGRVVRLSCAAIALPMTFGVVGSATGRGTSHIGLSRGASLSKDGVKSIGGLNPLTWVAVLVLFLLRLPHLAGPLDDPHSWRQADTVGYSFAFARHGIDLLHPKVCWLGGYGTLIFEFPLTEAIASLFDRAFGFSPAWDRVVSLVFFLLSAFWLHRLVREIADAVVAELALIVYMVAPLSMFFSRAANVDFAAQALAHGFLFHAIRTARGGGLKHAIGAALCGALAAMIKGPYLLPVLPPLGLVMLAAASIGAAALAAAAVAVSLTAFAVWRGQVNAINAQAPDWTWLPGYYKEVNPWWWYVGEAELRLKPGNWIKIAVRLLREILTLAGVPLLLAMTFTKRDSAAQRPSPMWFVLAWLAGCLVYVSIFFPLNVRHDYYQIPFIAPLAIAIALGTVALLHESRPMAVRLAGAVLYAAVLVMAFLAPRKLEYYRVDQLREAAGAILRQQVPAGDLIVVVDHSSEYTDPRLLYRADRYGWAVKPEDIQPALLAHLSGAGARWLAYVSEPGEARLAPPAWLAQQEVVTRAVTAADGGSQPLAIVHLYRLGASVPAAASGRKGTTR